MKPGPLRDRIEAMWFDPYHAADVATCLNARARTRRFNAASIRRVWARGIAEGRLPKIMRPVRGWDESDVGNALRLCARLVQQVERIMRGKR